MIPSHFLCNLPQCAKNRIHVSLTCGSTLLQTVHVFTQSFYIRDVLIVHVHV